MIDMEEMETKYNTKIPAVKRLMREACELKDPTEEYSAHPLEENLFEWHFTVRGPPETDFENGVYHGRIILPNQYPMKPPNIILLTPNGRFEVNKKICLSISGHHPETWQPSWSIRTALLALIAFMPTAANGTIASLDYTPEERKALARRSQKWECSHCGQISKLLGNSSAPISSAEESQLIKSVIFKGEDATTALKAKEETMSKEILTENHANELVGNEDLMSNDLPGFSIGDRMSTFLISVILMAISFLVYRRLFLI